MVISEWEYPMTIQEARGLKVGYLVMQESGEKHSFFVIKNSDYRILLARSVESTPGKPMAYYLSKTLREMTDYKLVAKFKL